MNDPTIDDSGGGTNTPNDNGENNVVLDHFSSARILIAIIVLVVLYLLSKWLVSQQEPNVRVDGNQIFIFTNSYRYFIIFVIYCNRKATIIKFILDYRESSQHHWQYSDLILHPLHCNVCHNLLLVAKVIHYLSILIQYLEL